jgi:hypothetical protein
VRGNRSWSASRDADLWNRVERVCLVSHRLPAKNPFLGNKHNHKAMDSLRGLWQQSPAVQQLQQGCARLGLHPDALELVAFLRLKVDLWPAGANMPPHGLSPGTRIDHLWHWMLLNTRVSREYWLNANNNPYMHSYGRTVICGGLPCLSLLATDKHWQQHSANKHAQLAAPNACRWLGGCMT